MKFDNVPLKNLLSHCIAFVFVFAISACDDGETQQIREMAADIHAAQAAGRPTPQASETIENLDADRAFAIQKHLVDLHLDSVERYGFKAGLTTTEAQERFGVDQPVAGVLFATGHKNPGDTLLLSEYNNMAVETELGFQLSATIDQPINSVEELRALVKIVMPVMEFPNAAFGSDPTYGDLISANAGSAAFITGPAHEIGSIDANAVHVTLRRDTTVMNTGTGTDAMGDQWEVLRWLINKMIEQGYRIGPEDLLITGALGAAFPGEAGKYTADFGSLGKVDFHIQ